MKRNIFILYVLLLAGFLSGCEKYLTTTPSTTVVGSTVFQTVTGAQNALNGVYRQFKTEYMDPGFGFADCLIELKYVEDVRANDIVVDAGNQYTGAANNPNYSITGQDHANNAGNWNFFYKRISGINNILVNLSGASGSEELKKEIEGQCRVLRAYCYFFLVQRYQQTYIIAKDMPALPYYDTPTIEGKARETVSVIYDKIVADLLAGIDLLSAYNRDTPHKVDEKVAQAILSNVYLVMNEWQKAADMANAARQGFTLMTADEFKSGFQSQNDEWMWTINQRADQNVPVWSATYSRWLNTVQASGGVGFCWVTEDFMNLFEPGDARFQFELNPAYGWLSFKIREIDGNVYPDVCLMRASEMYLIEAEALARSGSTPQAKTILNELQTARNATLTEATIDNILLERRKELYGEGFAFTDLLRTQQGVNHPEGSDHTHIGSIAAKSWRMINQIPVGETTTNFSINPEIWPAGDQNPYDGIYAGQ